MTFGCCAYCERPLPAQGSDAAVVAHHRPAWGAVGADGQVDAPAYWWCTYEWQNLYPACADCVRTRGSRFPVEGPRAGVGEGLGGEVPLLLDPGLEDADQHLRHEPDGRLSALSRRGQTTIDLLSLNRDALVTARLLLRQQWHPDRDDPTAGFESLRRQLAADADAAAGPFRPAWPALPTDLGGRVSQAAMQLVGPTLPPTTTGAEPGLPEYFSAARWIERVEITNFRPIRDLDLDLTRSTSDQGPWTVLLGENGSGKSSVLHAIALTLMGGRQRGDIEIDARQYLRRRAQKGLVRVHLSGLDEPLELSWKRGDAHFSGPQQIPTLLLGYGATRLLPRYGSPAGDDRLVRVDNLFNPLLALTDPTSWLAGLDQDTFDLVSEGIADLLALGPETELVRRRDRVVLRQGSDESPLQALSDGYQSMVVMSCDILRTVLGSWSHPALAEGIVLIDEVGAHLHPRWRMRVVGAIRRLMPRVQFVVTTHEPLCLRGVLDGEVVVVRRNSEGEVVAITDLPPVTGMRIDQLLTSEHLGLGSTDDPEVADLWESYYALQPLATRTGAQQQELDRVRARLDELDQLGATERERLTLNAAAEYIAERRQRGDAAVRAPEQVTADLKKLWAQHLPGVGP
ncbi:AAA family ATPase [Propionibacteriaceae bacterium Y1923]